MKVCVLPERMCVRSVGGAAPHMTHLLHLGGPWTFCARPNPDSHPSIMEPLRTDTAILPESLKMLPKSGKLPASASRLAYMFPRGRILCQGLMDIQGWCRPHIRFRLNWPFALSYTAFADPVKYKQRGCAWQKKPR